MEKVAEGQGLLSSHTNIKTPAIFERVPLMKEATR